MALANTLLVEATKPVWGSAPKDITGAGFDGDWVTMKNHQRLAVIIKTGAWAGGTSAVTLEQATDASGSGAKALSFSYQYVATGLTSDTLTKTAVVSDTFNLSAANKIHVIEVWAHDLDNNNGFQWVRARAATPGSNSDFAECLYVLYQSSMLQKPENQPSAIA